MSSRALTLVLSLLVAAGLLAGCGGSGASTSGAEADRPNTIPSRQIESIPSRGPQRTVLEWWRAVQLNDPDEAIDLYLEPPRMPDLAGQFNYVAGELDGTVAVAAVKRQGSQAEVRVRWRRPDGTRTTETLQLQDDDGAWKLLGARFLDEIVARMQREEAEDR
ncbi:MAG TPA: hypothetical protein VFY69_08680 [Solirubrobacterales bacterium]|nr:hypothetical protein [Solirubrobacterales bacterium]